MDADVLPRPDAAVAQEVREAVGVRLKLGVGQAGVTADDGHAVPDRVGQSLEQISVVELHRGRSLEVVAEGPHGRSLPTIHIAKNCAPPP